MKSLHTWKLISRSLHQNQPAMLMYVVESRGSSPGRKGFCMGINTNGEMEGSLGGGIMEHKFIEMAKSLLREGQTAPSIHKQNHNKTATTNQSGMICSGEQTIVLCPISLTDKPVIDLVITSVEQFRIAVLTISPQGLTCTSAAEEPGPEEFILADENNWRYVETLGYKNRLLIIGGGHCSLALSRMMRMIDFYIELYEDRPALKTLRENTFVHRKHLLDNYDQLSEQVEGGEHTFIVIMTVGYRTDAIALKALISKPVRYLGILGSGAKIQKMFSDFRSENYPEDALKRLHAPIGLPIRSQTPEEVAISIAAEIISVKNKT